ncbi:MAG: helix-turn-helix domain-containing protein [Methylophilaceae bacterium]|nr:helix-turn-helix domain-containing protein [Methylophilaceae bacterium]
MDKPTQILPGERSFPERGFRLSTEDIPLRERRDWLQEIIRQEYTKVEITPSADGELLNEMTFYSWEKLRLSIIRSHAITLERLRGEPYLLSQDNYFAVIPLSGDYVLEQNGREVFLQPGDMAIYDATQTHRLQCSRNFSKLIISIPRAMMRDRMAGIEHCTALRIPGNAGIGLVTSSFIRSAANQADTFSENQISALSLHALDLLTLALASVQPQTFNLSRSRLISLNLVKDFVERHLSDSTLDTSMIAAGVDLSPRYINDLFSDEDNSLMRFVWQRRLENCRKDMLNSVYQSLQISEIAYRWGFNDMSHFSRAFRQRFACSPSALRAGS